MKVLLWIYGVVSTMYYVLYVTGAEIVVRYAVGPLWLMMMVGVAVLAILVALPFLNKISGD